MTKKPELIQQLQRDALRGLPQGSIMVGREDVMSVVESLSYEVRSRRGRLNLPADCCADRDGAIRIFTDIDPGVKFVEVYAGGDPDAVYEKVANEWVLTWMKD